jgi:hypothetical protein
MILRIKQWAMLKLFRMARRLDRMAHSIERSIRTEVLKEAKKEFSKFRKASIKGISIPKLFMIDKQIEKN